MPDGASDRRNVGALLAWLVTVLLLVSAPFAGTFYVYAIGVGCAVALGVAIAKPKRNEPRTQDSLRRHKPARPSKSRYVAIAFISIYVLVASSLTLLRFEFDVFDLIMLSLICAVALPFVIFVSFSRPERWGKAIGFAAIFVFVLFFTEPGFRLGQYSLLFLHRSALVEEVERIHDGEAPRELVGGLRVVPDESGPIRFVVTGGLVIGPTVGIVHAPRGMVDLAQHQTVDHLVGPWYWFGDS